MAGAAVVASHCAGASILLDSPRNGRVVQPGDSPGITAAINDLEASDALSPHSRRIRMEWARERLTARAGASYFEEIVRHRIAGTSRPKEFYL